MTAETLLASAFATLPELIRAHGTERADKVALIDGERSLTYAALDARMDRAAAALQRDGVTRGTAVAILGTPSLEYVTVFLGALRAGCTPTPLQPSATPDQLAAMVADCAAPIVFLDTDLETPARKIRFAELDGWLAPEGAHPAPVIMAPADPFNIIYSSGTTGTPKGIVQPHSMRWNHVSKAGPSFGQAVMMIATPLYSNTTLVAFLPTLGWGGTAVLMPKFEARTFLELAQKHRATHVMLVPVQYQRIMALPDFDSFDLTSFQLKFATSAPFPPGLKADVVARWPGLLIEYYGMTEGGGTTMLVANQFPHKLHTVGMVMPGAEIRLIDDEGNEVSAGEAGEIVGRSGAMMSGYHRRDDASTAATWHDAEGNRYIRHGDLGRFDEDGFLTLLDRKKDLIISGGFNIYPSDLEAILAEHPDVADCAVVGVPSEQWGETPIGFYAGTGDPAEILTWFNAKVGKTQRVSALEKLEELPRSAIGKVLKRDLRDQWLDRQ